MLESIKDFCQEVVIVIDNRHGEQDKIKEICLPYTDRLFEYDWATDSFAEMRLLKSVLATGYSQ
jgi:hypothetical protein